jgi:hypothetical protein
MELCQFINGKVKQLREPSKRERWKLPVRLLFESTFDNRA